MPISTIETNILSKDFQYLQPFFIITLQQRALEIFRILFPAGADALFFDYWLYDDCWSGAPELESEYAEDIEEIHKTCIENRVALMKFLFHFQERYRHSIVKGLSGYGDDCNDDTFLGRNRVVCYADGKAFDVNSILSNQINCQTNPLVNFVSFEKELIFSVYDDRGCDIVFSTHEAMTAFYEKLEPYFLDYDRKEMFRRMNNY